MRNRRNRRQASTDNVQRAVAPVKQPLAGPFPTAQIPAANMMLPNTSGLQVVGNGMPLGLPSYTSVDEYGRAYTPIMHYGPQTHSAPVPVAIAPAICQLNPIVSPVAFVPYAGQQESMLTTDDEKR